MSEPIITPDGAGTVGATTTSNNTVPPANTPAPTWTTGMSDEYRGWVENKGFKDPSTVIESYRNLEKLMGAPKEKLVRIPDKEDDPTWGEIHGRLGRPAEPKGYDLKGIKDPKFSEYSQKMFHELGLSKKQGEAVANKWREYYDGVVKEKDEAHKAQSEKEDKDLQKEWGQAYQQNTNIAKRAASVFGLDADAIDGLEKGLGYPKTMKLLHDIGAKLGEGNFVSGSGVSGISTPAVAIQQIQDLQRDPEFVRRYVGGDVDARDKMSRLHKMAYPD